jgi:hypothetical protein
MDAKNIKKGRRFIPNFLFLDKKAVESINSFDGVKHIKNISKGDKVYMYVSPLLYNAMQEFQRGRYSRDTEIKKSQLTKFLGEVLPAQLRVLMKKYVQPRVTPGINMHLIDFPYMIDAGDQYKIPFKDKPEGESLVTSLFEKKKMKKSELKALIKESLAEIEEPAYGGMGTKDSFEAQEEEYEEFQKVKNESPLMNLEPSVVFQIYDILKKEFPEIERKYTASAFFYKLNSLMK